jgi:diphthamide biosynthesis enzyme Dph1/Dph2-like protein
MQEFNYDLELEKAIQFINKNKLKLVCIQLPDGLKNKANLIQETIEKNTKSKIIIWAGSCFGACDIPEHIEKLDVNAIIQWGHSPYIK